MDAGKFFSVAASVTCIKLLLMNCYKSTDFEVHRNWLAITHNLPLSKWYMESTSQWTLDYPPLFAWFEFALSRVAAAVYGEKEPEMLRISADPYSSPRIIFFQRMSVIVTDLIYVYATYEWCKCLMDRSSKLNEAFGRISDKFFQPSVMLAMLFLWNPALLIVDHIHFQYNGLLSGLQLLSLIRMMEGRHLESAIWFALLLNMKHIYLYIAPAYFIYLLRDYCFDVKGRFQRDKFIKLGSAVAAVFIFSFGPFILTGQLTQVLRRLFPFKRGLSHAYWAPNFWALYNFADKSLSVFYGVKSNASMTGGLVQEYDHSVLPTITPPITLFCVLMSSVVAVNELWVKGHQKSSPTLFIRATTICSLSSFMFGWHVHEKAIILPMMSATPLALLNIKDARTFLMLAITGTFSLFPLLYEMAETPIKILLLLIYLCYAYTSLDQIHAEKLSASSGLTPLKSPLGSQTPRDRRSPSRLSVSRGTPRPSTSKSLSTPQKSSPRRLPTLLRPTEWLYLLGLALVQLYYSLIHGSILGDRLPFLPLMITSVYCFFGIFYAYINCYLLLLKTY